MAGLCEGGNEPPGFLKANKCKRSWPKLPLLEWGKYEKEGGNLQFSITKYLIYTVESALGAFERKILRRIIGPVNENGQWEIMYNQEVMEQYRDMDVVTHIKLRRLEWAGHINRMENQRISRKIMEGRIYGKRQIGRPKDRWADAVREDARQVLGVTAWKRTSLDRSDCKRRIEEVKARFGL
ncbi:hypothetical protein ANN_10794 [Periplaneta americana]|uniref:Uncharacterized protein n=1 Tax=Periplaneta americana TaxID=6978 RepID=A0ABQ8T4Y1_PERAM|nr:hypothetical protein ANN_10794 [Periplaneta americana]